MLANVARCRVGVLPALLFQQEDKHASKKYEEQEEDNADNENHGGHNVDC